jgi:transposase
MHQRAVQREDLLKQQIEQLRAQLRLREQQLFGRKTETTTATTPTATTHPQAPPRRPRGQQRGQKGPRRRDDSHLPARVEEREIPGAQCCCHCCGLPFAPVGGTEDSTLLEIEVKAHRRLIRRHRYRPTCDCGVHPGIVTGIVTGPPAPRVIPKSILGVSLLVEFLVDKYLSYRPTYRLLADLRTRDLDLSLGTVAGHR